MLCCSGVLPTSRRGWTVVFFLACVWYLFLPVGAGRHPFNIPIVGERLPEVLDDKPGCHMNGRHYSFGEQWSPVFIPQGLMVCIRCQCLPVEKKGLMQTNGRTMCRNIKDLCPVPACDNPVLKPGKCCKACEEDGHFEDKFSFEPVELDHEPYSRDAAANVPESNDFQALLVGRNVPDGPVSTRAIAIVRLTVKDDSVWYTVRYSHLDRPKYLQILHLNGNLLFRTHLVKTMAGDKQACGVWHKPLPIHMDYLRDNRLQVVISSARYPDGIVGGRIKVAPDEGKEIFSSLMTDTSYGGDGALASIAYSPDSKVASYNIDIGNTMKKVRQGIFTVSIMKGSKVLYKTKGTAVKKTMNLSGGWRIHKKSHRRQLARGRLRMRVKFADGQKLIGSVQPKLTCDVFQAILSPSSQGPQTTQSVPGAGSVVMQLGDAGRLHYSIRLSDMLQKVTRIRLEGYRRRKRGKKRTIANLMSSFVQDDSSYSGWANGTVKLLDADDIHYLLHDQLLVSVKMSKQETQRLRGRLEAMEYRHPDEVNPVLLTSTSRGAYGGAGHVWLSVDRGCRLRFDTVFADPRKEPVTFDLSLGRRGDGAGGETRVRLPFRRQVKKGFDYSYGTGEIKSISNELFRDLNDGRASLKLRPLGLSDTATSYEANVTVANTCWQYANDGDGHLAEDNRLPTETSYLARCNFEGHVYPEGTAWIPDVDKACTTCSCVKGKTLCQRMTCPNISCSNPIQMEGRCCPSCPNEDTNQMCHLGKDPRHYPLHSVWHPYLPTEGFSQCALCTCLPGRKVECYKQPCPEPKCPKSEWIPDDNNTCCYKCPDKPIQTKPEVEVQPQSDVDMDGACVVNGQVHVNGQTWHPTIHPFGYMKCFYCRCRDGNFTCGRVQCPVLKCAKRIKRPNVCCEECDGDQGDSTSIVNQPLPPVKKCRFGNEWYAEGQKWKPTHYNNTETENCVVCKCKAGLPQCRFRCPKICKTKPDNHSCCKHCPGLESTKVPSNNKPADNEVNEIQKKNRNPKKTKRKNKRRRDKRKWRRQKQRRKSKKFERIAKMDLITLLQ